jgi:polyisoprenoid-binding protein YceI
MEKSVFRTGMRSLLVVVLLAWASWCGEAQSQQRKSTITIHVAKSGFFSAFGHNHTVSAPIARLAVDEKSKTAMITVLTKEMKVMDPEVSAKDRAEIQATMLGPKVLDAQKFPEIKFTSSRIEATESGRFRVSGSLQLHGVTRELSFPVTGTAEHYLGKAKLKQTDFGIQPVSVGGGTVKVKDEIQIDFDVYPATQSQASRR